MIKVEKTFPIKSPEIEPSENNPFEHCKLNRVKYARILTKLVGSDSEGFVLALNNKWGTGKTTFIKMWNQYLKKEGYSTVMFNAWENDFISSPLTALIAELKSLEPIGTQDFEKVLDAASKITKGIMPALVKAVASKYIDTEVLVNLVKDSVDSVSESFKKEVNEYEKQKKSIESFKMALSDFVSSNSNGKPVIILIDELDRCRPNYSVSILESIKHLFTVPNVVFVLSIDKLQLESAICGVYGSENIDSIEYLRKFIDIEYSLPKPKPSDYFEFLYVNYDFESFFKSQQKHFSFYENRDRELFRNITLMVVENISLRNQQKIISHLRMSLLLHSDTRESFSPTLYVFLVYCKILERDFYSKIVLKEFELKELQTSFYDIASNFDESSDRTFALLEASLMLSYCYSKYNKNTVFSFDIDSNIQTEYHSKFNDDFYLVCLRNIDDGRFMENVKISKILNKINLVDDFNLA